MKDLGEAYVMTGEPGKALELLEPLYRRAPQFEATLRFREGGGQ